ncbi:MAG: hypothetical protein P1V97_28665 [Planctomycetota bacterium]|nr:hypothetical protein [Planctomycetota bacterium]
MTKKNIQYQTIKEMDRLKRESRAEDRRQIQNGEKTPEQLARENGFFRFPKITVHYP